MERSVKKSTFAVNRANFENARKILFGTSLIPGTNRERWTTAGSFDIKKATQDKEFQLGKFTFMLKGRSIYLDNVKIAAIGTDRFLLLLEKLYYYPKLDSNCRNDANRDTISSVFLKDDQLYINYNITYGANSSYSSLNGQEGLWKNISDIESAKKRYLETKYSILKDFKKENESIKITCDDKIIVEIDPNEFKEGIFQKGDALIMISEGFPGLKLSVSTPIQVDPNLKKFKDNADTRLMNYEYEFDNFDTYPPTLQIKKSVMFVSDFNYLNEAVSWLMHVLTGPDPRTFNSPLPNRVLIDQLKESSEPKKIYKGEELVFFAGAKKDTRDALDLYYKTIRHLQNFKKLNYNGERQPANFSDNYATFIYGDQDSELIRTSPMTPKEFKEALERLKQYEQHEFTGNMMNFRPF